MHFANGVRKDKEGEAEERRISLSSLIIRIVFILQNISSVMLRLLSSTNPKLNQDEADAAFRSDGNNQCWSSCSRSGCSGYKGPICAIKKLFHAVDDELS